ncbi:MAG: ATP-binding protein, partial [Oscillospiraceae bacterium]|nr:ATP-binding protein [Oscillospiraceae bacterium]
MKSRVFILFLIIMSLMLSVTLSIAACTRADVPRNVNDTPTFTHFTQIPDVTEAEIDAVRALQHQYDSFSFAMPASIEAFTSVNGDIRGYSALFCEWLTELFEIPFTLQEHQFPEILKGLEDGSIDFTGTMTISPERQQEYHMTTPIAERSLKYFRLEDSAPVDYIRQSRKPVYAMLAGSIVSEKVKSLLGEEDFEYVMVEDYDTVYGRLVSGEIDAYIHENHTEAVFIKYDDVVVSDFFPMVISPVAFSAAQDELKPIIDIMQKALNAAGRDYLAQMYERGYIEYLSNSLYSRLSIPEREYLNSNPTVQFGAEHYNYPLSFYNTYDEEWEGIVFDVLGEISKLTGITFERANEPDTPWYDLNEMLLNGEISFVTELLRTHDREDSFIWHDTPLLSDSYALLSKSDRPDVRVTDVYNETIGLTSGMAYSEAFNEFFPGHTKIKYYDTLEKSIAAMESGEIDLMMASTRWILTLTNYHELSGYRVNLAFDKPADSFMGFNQNEAVLCSIIEKSLRFVDVEGISTHWTNKTYDYRLKMAHEQIPLLLGLAVLLLCVIVLLVVLFNHARIQERRLERLVTERTDELEKQTSIMQAVFDTSPDLIFCMGLDLNYIQINKSMEKHFQLSHDDFIGKGDGEVTNVPDSVKKIMRDTDLEVLKEKKGITLEEVVPDYSGKEFVFETTKLPLWVGDEMAGILGIAHNITERKALEEELIASSRYKSAFLANMSHELRTPLNVVVGLTALMLEEEGLPPAINHNHISIHNAGNTLLSIVNDILDISKIESGKLELIPVEYHIPSLLNDTATLINTYIGEKPIVFKLSVPPNLPGMLFGDEVRVKQIMNNLLSNAVKYTKEGEIVLTVKCESADDKSKDVRMIISVSDTGMGIREEDINKLFSDYAQMDMKTNRQIEGTGLGLSITRQLAEMMDGNITVKSTYGKGSTFTVTFMQGYVNDTVIDAAVADSLCKFKFSDDKRMSRHKLVRADLSNQRVLIVDDVQNNLDVASGLMKKYNLKIDCVLRAKDAVERIRKGTPQYNAVFMDHMMPEMDGIEAAIAIRNLKTDYAQN